MVIPIRPDPVFRSRGVRAEGETAPDIAQVMYGHVAGSRTREYAREIAADFDHGQWQLIDPCKVRARCQPCKARKNRRRRPLGENVLRHPSAVGNDQSRRIATGHREIVDAGLGEGHCKEGLELQQSLPIGRGQRRIGLVAMQRQAAEAAAAARRVHIETDRGMQPLRAAKLVEDFGVTEGLRIDAVEGR